MFLTSFGWVHATLTPNGAMGQGLDVLLPFPDPVCAHRKAVERGSCTVCNRSPDLPGRTTASAASRTWLYCPAPQMSQAYSLAPFINSWGGKKPQRGKENLQTLLLLASVTIYNLHLSYAGYNAVLVLRLETDVPFLWLWYLLRGKIQPGAFLSVIYRNLIQH